MAKHFFYTLSLLLVFAVLYGFSGDEAFHYLTIQTDLGPRNPGSPGHEKLQNWLISQGNTYGDTVIIQAFTGNDPFNNKKVALKNILVRYNPAKKNRVMLSAHYDTRPVADHDPDPQLQKLPILGANDGASGVAVLVGIMHHLKKNPHNLGVDIMFWDGEDLGRKEHAEEFCQGSRYYSYHVIEPSPKEGILIDMIGDAELEIFFESQSMQYHPDLEYRIFELARELGFGNIFIPKLLTSVYDDHVPLNLIAGIPTIDLIDFRYPNAYENYWHTQEDLPDKCSPESLEIIGTLLIEYLENR